MDDIVLSRRGTGNYFTGYVMQRIERNKNFLACVTGPTGSGKSYSTLALCERLDPDFTIERCCFSIKEFMMLINSGTLRSGSCLMLDEFGVAHSAYNWQAFESRLFLFLMQTFRNMNLICFFTVPNLSFISAGSRRLLHCHMETVGINQKERKVKLKPLLLQVSQADGTVYRKYLRVIVPGKGVLPLKRISVEMPSDDLREAYEAKKDAYTQELNRNILAELEERDKKPKKELTDRQEEILRHFRDGKNVLGAAHALDVTESMIYQQMKLIQKKGIELKPVKIGAIVTHYEVIP